MRHKKRVVLFTHDSIYSRLVLDKLIDSKTIEIVGVVLSNCVMRRGKSSLFENLYLLKNVGLMYSLYLFYVSFILTLIKPKLKSFNKVAKEKGITLYKVSDVNIKSIELKLTELSPDFILSFNFNQKISKTIFCIPKIAALNIHPSLLPLYRGVDPLLSARIKKESLTGVTIHLIREKLDEGDILLQQTSAIDYHVGLVEGYKKLFVIGAELSENVISNFKKYYNERIGQNTSKGSYYGWPKHGEYTQYLKRKIKKSC
jgi:methionyl-tRNA formyltransferase